MTDVETSLEVDHMILDYLLYQALDACFNEPHSSWNDQGSSVERSLLQVDEFHALFKTRYPKYKLDGEITFRLELLQLVALFTQRLRRNSTTPTRASLQRLREKNAARARGWIEHAARIPTASFDIDLFDSAFPIPHDELERNRSRVLDRIGLPSEDEAHEGTFYGTKDSVSLLDLLPLFMKVSASCSNGLELTLGNPWMKLATDLMIQACLEQYLAFGASGTDAIDESFAWGYKTMAGKEQEDVNTNVGQTEEHDEEYNIMFKDEDDMKEVAGWADFKREVLETLLFSEERDLLPHLMRVEAQHPYSDCDKNTTLFLQSLSKIIPKPVLVQLEEGQLDHMSKAETQEFMYSCGLDISTFLSAGVV